MSDYYYKIINLDNNYTKIPNDYIEKKAKTHFSETEQAIMTVIERNTFGYNKDRHEMSISFFSKATHKTRRAIVKSLISLKNRNIILSYGVTKKRTSIYGICLDFSLWDSEQIDTISHSEQMDTIHSERTDTIHSEQIDTIHSERTDTQKRKNIKKDIKKDIKKEQSPILINGFKCDLEEMKDFLNL